MKRIGMITVGRWMTEALPDGMIAYMEHKGKLFRLREVQCFNGHLRPLFETPGCCMGAFPYNAVQYRQAYTPESPVFLTMGGNLVGTPLADITDSVEEMQDRCWALQEGDGFVTSTEPVGAMAQTAPAQDAESGDMWYS